MIKKIHFLVLNLYISHRTNQIVEGMKRFGNNNNRAIIMGYRRRGIGVARGVQRGYGLPQKNLNQITNYH